MTDPSSDPAYQPDVATAAATAADQFSQMHIVAETTAGYYAKLVEANIPVEAATRMAEEFHHALIENLQAQMKANIANQTLKTFAEIGKDKRPAGIFPKRGQ